MIFRFIVLCAFALIHGCTTTPAYSVDTPLYKLEQYLESTNSSSIELLRKYWSKEFVANGAQVLLDKSKSNKMERDTVNYLVRFNNQIRSVSYKYETISSDKACVLIIGKNEVNEKVVINVPYLFEEGAWLINGEIIIHYPQPGELLPTLPNCSDV